MSPPVNHHSEDAKVAADTRALVLVGAFRWECGAAELSVSSRGRPAPAEIMAGTRLAAHVFFLVFSLISVMAAWRLGIVKRAPLPLEKMADPFDQQKNPPQRPAVVSSSSTQPTGAGSTPGGPLPPTVDIDLVLLRSPKDGDCASCAAVLDELQANPSLGRNAFRAAEEKAERVTTEDYASAAVPTTASPFTIRDVHLRVVHIEHGLAAGNAAAAPLLASSSDGGNKGGGPAALDDWLHENFISRPREPHLQFNSAAGVEATKDTYTSGIGTKTADNSRASLSSLPRYTFFIACAGMGNEGETPTFIMGKRRHGYLGLGCTSSSCSTDSDSCSVRSNGGRSGGGQPAASGSSGVAEVREGSSSDTAHTNTDVESSVVPRDSSLASAALQALAGLVVAHVLRSPVRQGDVHVRRGQAYRLNFSLLSEDPAVRRCTWDFARASRRYLRPLLRKLGPVASFAVQSQEVLFARLSATPPRFYSGGRRWYYSPEDLQGFLGANDFPTLDLAAGWGTGSSSSKEATRDGSTSPSSKLFLSSSHSQIPVNLMVFCPSPQKSPLVFMENWRGAGGRNRPFAEAYEVPGFGGVSVVNAAGNAGEVGGGGPGIVDALEPERLRRAFGAHVAQLRRIIGLPRPSDRPSEAPWPGLLSLPPSSREQNGSATVLPLTFLPSPADGVTDWEVDALLRAEMARNRGTAIQTLRSLAALVESQPEMEVSEKIADDVAAALAALANADASISEATAASVISRTHDGGAVVEGTCDDGSFERSDYCSLPRRRTVSSVSNHHSYGWEGADAMHWAREALRRSEEAYFDPTMVPQLYFPQDHLMAVYFPFLAPLAFPLIVGFAQELLRYYRKTRRKRISNGTKSELN